MPQLAYTGERDPGAGLGRTPERSQGLAAMCFRFANYGRVAEADFATDYPFVVRKDCYQSSQISPTRHRYIHEGHWRATQGDQ